MGCFQVDTNKLLEGKHCLLLSDLFTPASELSVFAVSKKILATVVHLLVIEMISKSCFHVVELGPKIRNPPGQGWSLLKVQSNDPAI